uniref:F-box domain-containing protein n=1 Tax=Clastoptera arizonana TaxID=38151 RepID=A0A1B6EC13_9HEMI
MLINPKNVHILDLPDELMVYLFSFFTLEEIDALKAVCKQFYEVGAAVLVRKLHWIRRCKNIVCQNEKEDATKRRKRKHTRRSTILAGHRHYRRNQSYIVTNCLSQLFVSAFLELITKNVYPSCPGRIVQLYIKALLKTNFRGNYASRSLETDIYEKTMQYNNSCELNLRSAVNINMKAVLRTFLAVLDCFPENNKQVTSEQRVVYYYCLPGWWLHIRRRGKEVCTTLTTQEILSIMSCLYPMAASCIIKFYEATYFNDLRDVIHKTWPKHSVSIGNNRSTFCQDFFHLIFEFTISSENYSVGVNRKLDSGHFSLTITSVEPGLDGTSTLLGYSYHSFTPELQWGSLKKVRSLYPSDNTRAKKARLL